MNWNTKELEDYDPKDYMYHGFWPSGVLANYFWGQWYHKDEASLNTLPEISAGSFTYGGGHNTTSKYLMKTIEDFIKTKLNKEGIIFFENVIKNFEGRVGELDEKYLQGEKVKAENFLEYIHDLRRLHFYWGFGWYFSTIFEGILIQACKENNISENDLTSYAKKVASLLANQQDDLRRIKKIFQDEDKNLEQEIEKHIEEYGWVEWISFKGRSVDKQMVLDQIRDIQPSTVKSRYDELGDTMKMYFNLAAQASYLNQLGAEHMSRITFKTKYVLDEIENKLKITHEELISLLPQEIEDALKGTMSTTELRKIIDYRQGVKFISFTNKDGKYVFSDDDHDIEQIDKLTTPKFDHDVKEIKGNTANKGKVEGRVKVILSPEDFHKFNEGEILVTTMTTPDFVILMQKSAAIITDIGGMLSHAAIVSRELGKPCIIGTKFATKALKDGMEVEVDANTGVVKIL